MLTFAAYLMAYLCGMNLKYNIMKATTQEDVNKMSIIINIQLMQEKIFGMKGDLNQLLNLNYDQLFDVQNSLIPDYNASLKVNQIK